MISSLPLLPWTPRRPLLALLALTLLLALPAAAGADTATSSNWAGYAIHRGGVSFRRATGTWTIPKAQCTHGNAGFSATWVGIGGYALDAHELEQTGTETDCLRSGRARDSAWFEIVPEPSHPLKLRVHPGDTMTATVLVIGRQVTLTLQDRTTHRTARRAATVAATDTGSAEWIVEAPSDCTSPVDCTTLPLADFGAIRFSHASAEGTRGQRGSIGSARWSRTKITLATTHHGFLAHAQRVPAAAPSPLAGAGRRFRVAYLSNPGPVSPMPLPLPGTDGNPSPPLSATLRAGSAWYVQPGGRRAETARAAPHALPYAPR